MGQNELEKRAQAALNQWLASESSRKDRLAARGDAPEPGDVYVLPCHSGADPSWLVVEGAPDNKVRLVPGDERPWANVGDLWVGDDRLCLRLEHEVMLAASLLQPANRIDVYSEAPAAILDHEASLRFGRVAPREEDEGQHAWRRALARTARMLPRFLQDGVVELRLSEFICEDGSPAADVFAGEKDRAGVAGETQMAADSSSATGALLHAVEDGREPVILHELDVECGGTLTLVASRQGLGFQFEPSRPGMAPPAMQLGGEAVGDEHWVSVGADEGGAVQRFCKRDWHRGPLALQLQLQRVLTVELANDLWAPRT